MPRPAAPQAGELARALSEFRRWSYTPNRRHPRLPPRWAAIRDALREETSPSDPAEAAAIAEELAGGFPNCRVNVRAYARGLAAIAADDEIPAAVIRATARRVRARSRALPPLADLRQEMLTEARERRALLAALETHELQFAALARRDAAAASAVADAARRIGIDVTADALLAAWCALDWEGIWFADRPERYAPREALYQEFWLIAAIERGTPQAAEAATLVADIAAYCRTRPRGEADAIDKFADALAEFSDRMELKPMPADGLELTD